ncbi:MAG TPA: YniB family protein [Paraburkholderia sp.]|uniref:YniB family protein n=1 Tax=Paraburkholderia sp. TaxID=1926495 RepID=UPI002B458D3C|nr:YniB family protein [Paraburkholderia sp.]HKR40406.1 YniB family protein [Paraburkholderia sp.]
MKIAQAQKQVTLVRIISYIITGVSSAYFFAGMLLGIYHQAENFPTAFSGIAGLLEWGIGLVYEYTKFLSFIWDHAPEPDLHNLNTEGNYWLLLCVACFVLARTMRDSASLLAARIKRTIERVEELGWEQALLRQQGQFAGGKPDVLQINIDLDQREQWYKRPAGLIVIGVAIAVLGQLANLQFGLIH